MMKSHKQWRGAAVMVVFALSAAGCGKQADSAQRDDVPEVAGDEVPDVAANAQAGSSEVRELERYQLTMENVMKMAKANEIAKRLAPQQIEIEEDVEFESLDDVEDLVESNQVMRRAIEEAGLTPREFALTMFALIQAQLAQLSIQQGMNADSIMQELRVHPANVRFLQQHAAELAKLNKAAQ